MIRTVLKEIEDIRAGLWDKDIQTNNLSDLPAEFVHESATATPLLSERVGHFLD